MKKTRTIGNFELTDVKYIYRDFYGEEDEIQNGIFVHELTDEFGNGDGIIEAPNGGVDYFDNEQEVIDYIQGNYLDTDYEYSQSRDVYYLNW
ncbi:MAG: hypothetical protein ACI4XP_03190 [Acutalibacteraceae bacterium]